MKALYTLLVLGTVMLLIAGFRWSEVRRYEAFTDPMTLEIAVDPSIVGTYRESDIAGEVGRVVNRRSHCYGVELGGVSGSDTLRTPHLLLSIHESRARQGRRAFEVIATISARETPPYQSDEARISARGGDVREFYRSSTTVDVPGVHSTLSRESKWRAVGDTDPELRDALQKALPEVLDRFSLNMGTARERLYGPNAQIILGCPARA